MVSTEQKKALEESMALAEKIQNEEDLAAAQAEIDKEDAGQGAEAKGEPITAYVK